jgi:hypothetical protein
MVRYILTILFVLLSFVSYSQFTYSGYIYNSIGTGIANVPVKVFKRTTTTTSTGTTSVRIFRTHAGNGSTNQYAQYPMNRVEMDKCFNTAWSNTTLWWSGNIASSASLNFNQYTTLTAAGASVPGNGDFYATEVTFVLYPKETGTYTFGLTSDDGGDLWLNGYGNVIEWYGGKGTGQYLYGSVSLVAGTAYTFIARMQEYGGGDGLLVWWKRPSQVSYSLQPDEIGQSSTTTTAWTLDATVYTNTSGLYSISRPTGTGVEWYLQYDAPTPITTLTNTDITAVSNIVNTKTAFNGIHYYMYDVNGDNKITISDAYYINGRRWNIFTDWISSFRSRYFTTAQYNAIKATTSNLKVTHPGVSSITINNPISGGTANYYLIAPGYSGTTNY